MKRAIKGSEEIFGMANLNPQKAGLGSIVIWSYHGGVSTSASHRNSPRVKMDKGDMSISVTISKFDDEDFFQALRDKGEYK